MQKSYELKNRNSRVKAVEIINIETEQVGNQEYPDNNEIIDRLDSVKQTEYDLRIAKYFIESIIMLDLKKTTHSDKIDV